jgi:hypothetical protein
MPYSHAAEQFKEANRLLYTEHPQGHAYSMGAALKACSLGMAEVHRSGIDPDAQSSFRMIEFMIDSSGLAETDPLDVWVSKAGRFEADQAAKLSEHIIDVLSWFEGPDCSAGTP